MIESITDMENYKRVIFKGEEFRRYSEKIWMCQFFSEEFQKILCPVFIETFYRKFLEINEGNEDK